MGQKWDKIQFNYLFFIDAGKLFVSVGSQKKTPLVTGLGVTSYVAWRIQAQSLVSVLR